MYKSSHLKSKPADRHPSGANIWQILIKHSGLDRIASLLVGALTDNSELKVNWKSDRHGNSYLEINGTEIKE
jgi:hypothetical protein